jgi:hypothetical protein
MSRFDASLLAKRRFFHPEAELDNQSVTDFQQAIIHQEYHGTNGWAKLPKTKPGSLFGTGASAAKAAPSASIHQSSHTTRPWFQNVQRTIRSYHLSQRSGVL